MKTLRRAAASGLVFLVYSVVASEPHPSAELNKDAVLYAKALIEQGHFTADRKNAWAEHRPSSEQENEFLRTHGSAEYARWHLVIDHGHGPDAKAGYKFGYGDFQTVHRCALLAIKSRARQFAYPEVEAAAEQLLELLESKEEATGPTR